MQNLARICLAAIAMTMCTAPGCNPIQFEWQGPSRSFKLIDPNRDGKVTRAEWEQTSAWSQSDQTFVYPLGSAYEFIAADCDGNGVYTWREYFRRRFKSMTCSGMRDDLGVTKFLRHRRPEIVLAKQWPALRTAQMARQFETMLAGVAPSDRVVRQYVWPKHHYEISLAAGRPILVTVAATRISRRHHMARAAWIRRSGVDVWREPGDYDVVEIELVNEGQEPIAVVMLQIRADTNLGDYETVHIKNVYIEPSGRENLQAWYPAVEQYMFHDDWLLVPFGAKAAEVSVLGVRLAGSAM